MTGKVGPRPVSLVSILFVALFSSCARSGLFVTLPPSLYATVPAEKSLRAIRQFFLVDDFNNRETKNLLGEAWRVEVTKPGKGEFKLSRKDALNPKRGGSSLLKVSLPALGEARFGSSLKGMDLSRADALVFMCRARYPANGSFHGTIELLLKDLYQKSAAYDFTGLCLSEGAPSRTWKEIIVPRQALSEIDWNELDRMEFRVSSGASPFRGLLGLDEIAFHGPGDLEFLSQKDNLAGFPGQVFAAEKRQALLTESSSERFLLAIARDTWKYFENAIDRKTQLPVDHLRVGEPEEIGAYTTPTNLALYFMACVAARELGIISRNEAAARIKKSFQTLRRMKRWQGFHYNFYNTRTLQVTREYVSAVDSGWLAAAWIVVRQAFPGELAREAAQFLNEINFYEYYDPSVKQLRLGFDEAVGSFAPYHYGLIATEARLTSFIGIGKGDLPREHWWSIYRTPPAEWDWQSQVPEGKETERGGVSYFQGYYNYQGKKFVPSWGGSLFEFLMPALVLKERELSPKGFGMNNRVATEIQIDYALNRQGYPIWGLSPASTSSGRSWRYGEYGVKYLGVKGYRDEGIISPYAAFLALDSLPDQAIDNIRRMIELYEIYGEYGFFDSVNVRNARVNPQYLALDQGMILVAIANHLRGGAIQRYFHQDEIAGNVAGLLEEESFFD